MKEDQLPSGQDDTNPPGSSNNGAGSSHNKDFGLLGLLTQYIGPPVADNIIGNRTNPGDGEIDRITMSKSELFYKIHATRKRFAMSSESLIFLQNSTIMHQNSTVMQTLYML